MEYSITGKVSTNRVARRGGWDTVVSFGVTGAAGRTFEVTVSKLWLDIYTPKSHQAPEDFPVRVEAVRQLKALLEQGIEVNQDIELPTDPALTTAFRTTKYCKYLEYTASGPICAVKLPGDKLEGATSLWVCQNSCNLPDTELLCRHLVHPETICERFDPDNSRSLDFDSRKVVSAICNLNFYVAGEDIEMMWPLWQEAAKEVVNCQMGRRNCWHLNYVPRRPSQEVSLDLLVDSVLSELDVLNRIFGENYEHQPFKNLSFRTSRDLGKVCSNQSDFMNNVSALSSIICDMSFKPVLKSVAPKGSGSITHLAQFLSERFTAPEYVGPIENVVRVFKDINTLRLQYPVHAATSAPLTAAHGRLGIAFPIDNHEKAWYSVMQHFLDALRQLRAMISQ